VVLPLVVAEIETLSQAINVPGVTGLRYAIPKAAYEPAVAVNVRALPLLDTSLELATDPSVSKRTVVLLATLLSKVVIDRLLNRSIKKFMVEISATRTATGWVVGFGSDVVAI
jgi:hypothetical protein